MRLPLLSSSKQHSDILQGDFIYADIPVYHGDSKHAYRRLYRRNYNSPSFRKVYERLRASSNLYTRTTMPGFSLSAIIYTYDDHEVWLIPFAMRLLSMSFNMLADHQQLLRPIERHAALRKC